MKNKLLAIVLLFVLLSSCDIKTKEERFIEMDSLFPNSKIIAFDSEILDGWNYIIYDTINNRAILVLAYKNAVDFVQIPLNK